MQNSTTTTTTAPPAPFTLATYKGQTAAFYIQSRGAHTGRPLRTPIPNCWAVTTERGDLFALAEAVYRSGAYRHMMRGSVIPFLTITATADILGRAFAQMGPNTPKLLDAIAAAQAAHANAQRRLDTLEDMITLLCRKAVNLHH